MKLSSELLEEFKSCIDCNPYINMNLIGIVDKELNKILTILLEHPKANNFYYDKDGQLYYSLPEHETVNGNSLILNDKKTKEFLKLLRRDIKLKLLLNEGKSN